MDGNICLTSVNDEEIEICMSSSGLFITVKYLYMLPFKKATWTHAINKQENSNLKNITSSHLSGNKDQSRRMKMQYEYIQMTQFFTINRFPPRWCYPISLLYNYQQDLNESNSSNGESTSYFSP